MIDLLLFSIFLTIFGARVTIFIETWKSFFSLRFFCKIKSSIGQLDISDGSKEIGDRNCVRISGKKIGPFSNCRNAKPFRTDFEKLSHRRFRVSVDALQELEGVVCVAVDDVDADGRVDVMRKRVFANERTRNSLEKWNLF